MYVHIYVYFAPKNWNVFTISTAINLHDNRVRKFWFHDTRKRRPFIQVKILSLRQNEETRPVEQETSFQQEFRGATSFGPGTY